MYQNKYLKYKQKYLDLKKAQIEQINITNPNSLTGGAKRIVPIAAALTTAALGTEIGTRIKYGENEGLYNFRDPTDAKYPKVFTFDTTSPSKLLNLLPDFSTKNNNTNVSSGNLSNSSSMGPSNSSSQITETDSKYTFENFKLYIEKIYENIFHRLTNWKVLFSPIIIDSLETIYKEEAKLYGEIINNKNLPLLIALIRKNRLNIYYIFPDNETFIEKIIKQFEPYFLICLFVELINKKEDIETLFRFRNKDNQNLLHLVFQNPNTETIQLILVKYYYSNIKYLHNEKDNNNNLPEYYLDQNRNPINKEEVNKTLEWVYSVFFWTKHNFDETKLLELYNIKKNQYYRLLLLGEQKSAPSTKSLEDMIKYSLVPNFWEEDIKNELNQTALIKQVIYGTISGAEYLLQNCPNNEIKNKWVNEEDITGNTALYYAIDKGDINLIKLLLANKAVIKQKDHHLLETKKSGIKFLKPNPLSSTVINEIEQILANHK